MYVRMYVCIMYNYLIVYRVIKHNDPKENIVYLTVNIQYSTKHT